MTRYEGASRKGAPDVSDLAILARKHRELHDAGTSINLHNPAQYPTTAAWATVFYRWVEISG